MSALIVRNRYERKYPAAKARKTATSLRQFRADGGTGSALTVESAIEHGVSAREALSAVRKVAVAAALPGGSGSLRLSGAIAPYRYRMAGFSRWRSKQ